MGSNSSKPGDPASGNGASRGDVTAGRSRKGQRDSTGGFYNSMNEITPIKEKYKSIKEQGIEAPLALLAELSHRCPLQCPYCSNPVQLEKKTGLREDKFGEPKGVGASTLLLLLYRK